MIREEAVGVGKEMVGAAEVVLMVVGAEEVSEVVLMVVGTEEVSEVVLMEGAKAAGNTAEMQGLVGVAVVLGSLIWCRRCPEGPLQMCTHWLLEPTHWHPADNRRGT